MSLLLVVSLVACTPAKPSSSPSAVKPASSSTPGLTTSAAAPAAPQRKISGAGIIGAVNYANLNFGSAGQIIAINVKKMDRVTKGTVLAKLDTADLEASLAQAKVAQDQSQVGLTQAKVAMDQALLAQIVAKSALAGAQFNLDKTQAISDIKDAITNDQMLIKAAQVQIQAGDTASTGYLNQYITQTNGDLLKQQKKLQDLLNTAQYADVKAYYMMITYSQQYDLLTVDDVRMKQLAVEAAQKSVDQAAGGIALAQTNIDQASKGIVLAQKNLDLITKRLDQATITAPFDGQAASVNQRVGDFISVPAALPKPVIYLIDPSSLELVISVNELDVPQVKLGQKAIISIDAFPGSKLDGQVSVISSVPTLHGSVVDYDITISFSAPKDMEVRVGMNAAANVASR